MDTGGARRKKVLRSESHIKLAVPDAVPVRKQELSVVKLSVVILGAVKLSAVKLSAVKLSVVKLSVAIANVRGVNSITVNTDQTAAAGVRTVK